MAVFGTLAEEVNEAGLQEAILITLRRGIVGFALAVVIGVLLALAVVRFKPLRTAIGALISGIQTMPSIAWFPLAILLFQLTEQAIMFVVILGAAPSIANGLISGVDQIPRVLLRAAKVMGARGFDFYRHVLLPAALPSFVGGLKQGWAFAWRSLMAGELLVIIAGQSSIGHQAGVLPRVRRRRGPAGHDDRHPGHRHRHRLGLLRHRGAVRAAPLGPRRGSRIAPSTACGDQPIATNADPDQGRGGWHRTIASGEAGQPADSGARELSSEERPMLCNQSAVRDRRAQDPDPAGADGGGLDTCCRAGDGARLHGGQFAVPASERIAHVGQPVVDLDQDDLMVAHQDEVSGA